MANDGGRGSGVKKFHFCGDVIFESLQVELLYRETLCAPYIGL